MTDLTLILPSSSGHPVNAVHCNEVTHGASNGSLKAILRKSREDIAAMRNNGVNPLVALPYKNFSKLPQFLGVKFGDHFTVSG